MAVSRRALWLAFVGVGVASCGLVTGIGDLQVESESTLEAGADGAGRDTGTTVPPVDAMAPPADVEAPPEDASTDQDAVAPDGGCSTAGCIDLPMGFALVAYGPKGSACPSGFGAGVDKVETPSLLAGACMCPNCTTTTAPVCPSTGTIASTLDNDGSKTCGTPSPSITAGGCASDGFLGPFGATSDSKFIPPPGGPTGGACTRSSSKDAAKVAFAAQPRVCAAADTPSTCNGKVCPALAAPFNACVQAPGDVACPTGFSQKHLAGDGATFSCSACGCGVTGVCGGGKLNFYDAANCVGTAEHSVVVNGTCVSSASTLPLNGTYISHRYVADPPTNVSCTNNGGTSGVGLAMTSIVTICCP